MLDATLRALAGVVASSSAQVRSRGGASLPADDTLVIVAAAAVGFVLLFGAVLIFVKTFLRICRPNQILVFSGRQQIQADGTKLGARILHGGRGMQIPLLEKVDTLDMRLFPVEVAVQNAYSKGGIPLSVHAIANVKIASSEAVRNAVERFLGVAHQQVVTAAQQTLEGVLREVVSQLTPEQVNEDRLKFAETLAESARDDLDKLGLELDVLKVQHVSDEQKYLANLGRGRIATMLRDAANAESTANQAVAEAEAAARQAAETAAKRAETIIAQKKNGLRAELAKLEAEAKQVENEANVAAETERAVAEQDLQSLRAELEKLRLHCDVILPAEAERKAAEHRARGEAAPKVETGKATAEALRLVSQEWVTAGEIAKEVYVLQQLRVLLGVASMRVQQAEIESVNVVSGADADAYTSLLAAHPAAVARVLEELGATMGIDIRALLTGPSEPAPSPPSARPSVPPSAKELAQ